MKVNRDYSDLLSAFAARRVRFLVVGAYALAFHGRPRATGDLDLWVEPSRANARRVYAALADFGAPLGGIDTSDFERPGTVLQIGVAPNRVDLLTSLTALDFAQAWKSRLRRTYGSIPLNLIAAKDMITNKRAVGRPRDIADAEELERMLRSPRRRTSRPRP